MRTAAHRTFRHDGTRLVAQRLSIPRLTGLERLIVEIRHRPLPRHGTDQDAKARCHRFRGFVYHHAHFSAHKKSIEVAVRPRLGSAAVRSRWHFPAPGYHQLAERRFEFIPLWGVRRLPPLRRCGVEEVPWGYGKRTLTKA